MVTIIQTTSNKPSTPTSAPRESSNQNAKGPRLFRDRNRGTERDSITANVRKSACKFAHSWYAPAFGTRGSQVQILPLRPFPTLRLRGAYVRLVPRRNPMSAILLINPANHRPRSPALDIGGKSIGGSHSAIHRHFLWSSALPPKGTAPSLAPTAFIERRLVSGASEGPTEPIEGFMESLCRGVQPPAGEQLLLSVHARVIG